jgi:hypothetical protein
MRFRAILIACVLPLVGCNYTDGPCWYRGEGGAFGGVGGSLTVGVGVGAGGFGEAPGPRPQALGDEPECNAPALEPDEHVACRKKAWGEVCKNECAKHGLACDAEWQHPLKPEVGMGKLFGCEGETGAEKCKYVYDNGDECWWDKKDDRKLCKYSN